jgi:hypothetical protein
MNERQRLIAALTFGQPDRFPLEPGWPRQSTLRHWHAQGLPPDVDWFTSLMDTLKISYQPPAGASPDLGIDFKLLPIFKKVLEHRDGHTSSGLDGRGHRNF